MPAGSVLAAAIPAVAGLIGDSMAQQGQQQTNAMNLAEIQQEEGWMTNMSNTAMQRRVQDLQSAGLNPLLAIGQGGASTPGIGQIPMQNPNLSYSALGSQMAGAVNSGISQEQAQSQVKLQNAQAASTQQDAVKKTADNVYAARNAAANTAELEAQSDKVWAQARMLEQEYSINQQDVGTLMKDPNFLSQMAAFRVEAAKYGVLAQSLQIPALENDALFQRAHPGISQWMSSGVPQLGANVLGSAVRAATRFGGGEPGVTNYGPYGNREPFISGHSPGDSGGTFSYELSQ